MTHLVGRQMRLSLKRQLFWEKNLASQFFSIEYQIFMNFLLTRQIIIRYI